MVSEIRIQLYICGMTRREKLLRSFSSVMYDGLSNNPFIDSSAANRFPDVNAISPAHSPPNNSQYTPWQQQQPPTGYNNYNSQQPQQQQWSQGAQPQSGQFQPSSSFGQQLSQHVNGGGMQQPQPQLTGYPQPQPQLQYNQTGFQQPQPTGYPTYGGGMGTQQQQQQQPMGNYLSEFDPYASIGQSWDGAAQQQQRSQGQLASYVQPPTNEHLHPREFIRKYKAELEIWDPATWKQMQNAFEALKDAWEKRMHEVEGRISQLSTNWGMAAQQDMYQAQQVSLSCLDAVVI